MRNAITASGIISPVSRLASSADAGRVCITLANSPFASVIPDSETIVSIIGPSFAKYVYAMGQSRGTLVGRRSAVLEGRLFTRDDCCNLVPVGFGDD